MEGPLSKWTNVMKGWQYRWFVLDDNAGLFSYYTSRDKMIRGVRRGCVRLRGAVIGIDDEDEATFTITVDGKTFHFQAQDSEERERWIRALEDTVLRHNQVRRGTARKTLDSSGSGAAASIEDFDKKLTETDSYLELLLGQVAQVKQKSEDSSAEKGTREMYDGVVKRAYEVTESIKHAIILLQIAKNAALPADATTGAVKDFSHLPPVHRSPTVTDGGRVSVTSAAAGGERGGVDKLLTFRTGVQTGIEEGAEVRETSVAVSLMTPTVTKADKNSLIPEISYSSSDEDDFFDAENEEDDEDEKTLSAEFAGGDAVSRGNAIDALSLNLTGVAQQQQFHDLQSPLTPTADNVDYDALYEDDDSDGDVDMKSHGSVITHLLSQVRIGMDLTKIVLPTFILERRSLLEMYSDFFAHPDLFVGIPEGQTPEERMIRVLRWYLSSFHAGRKSTIAKKPYNPIIGETFRCHWKLDDEAGSGDPVAEGPLPWCGANDLTFVAEQVSHHPPISAFYAEHASKRISVNAHIYTKSSFLGMSVAVHNVGQGKLTLIDHDEEYICTFPSGYGRSILTVPWIELGGKVTVTCPKTSYLANIEFKCKQFFSSEVNKLSAEVISPHSKKAILKVDGEWNGKMMAKWASGKNEVFIDVSKIPIHPKLCKSVSDQGRFESRRLWKDVTYGLKVGNIEAATDAKSFLEQRQREEASERKEKGQKWETKLFQPIGENWQFMTPLEKRLSEKGGSAAAAAKK